MLTIIFGIFAFVIVWAMGGYSVSLKIINAVKRRKLKKTDEYKPTVSVMIVAHNEEKVILDKLNNVIANDYPRDLIEYIVASDWSTDRTNGIVEKFKNDHPEIKLTLYKSKNHKGKTNAQNEAQKISKGEILVMTDANAMFERNAISELVSCFTADDIAYVTGRLQYVNSDNDTAGAESSYWEGDLRQREIESNIRTITAGNGAIYACRNSLYYDFDPIRCHDSNMPYFYAGKGLRAIYNPDAIAYEKAGENVEDEFKRKVRMNRNIITNIKEGIPALNVGRYGWFSYFYFGHRTCRYLLWLAHAAVFIISIIKSTSSWFFRLVTIGQCAFYIIAMIGYFIKSSNSLVKMITYYSMTIFAQWKGFLNGITGKSKPTWDKAESTR